ncbi:MAG: NAD(P)H-dependent oxidoreductase [Rhodobacteraceae bacterium]|nr:NAD(P)H-dependent oxidoreductase [Paracoccaceae bacterium]
MRALVIHAHPVPESYSAALRQTVVDTLKQNEWEVDLCDLYQENFNPILSQEERRNYHSIPENRASVESYIQRVQKADGIFFIYPVWIFGFPAILKGFLERVMVPGVAFNIEDGKIKAVQSKTNCLVCVATYGGNWLRAFMTLDPPRMIAYSNLRFYFQPNVFKYLALYDMNNADDTKRGHFLKKVKQQISQLQ